MSEKRSVNSSKSQGVVKNEQAKINDTLHINPDTLHSLLSFDLKFDSLKVFLDNLLQTMNQHASAIHALQSEVKTKLIENRLSEAVSKCADSIIIHDKELEQQVNLKKDSMDLKNVTGNIVDEASRKFCHNMSGYGRAISHVFWKIKDVESRVTKTEVEIVKKVDSDDFKNKLKENKKKIERQIEEVKNFGELRLAEIEKRISARMGTVEQKFKECEQNTVWKIQDCQDLIKIRVNDQYVKDSIRVLEEKMNREFITLNETKADAYDRFLREITNKLNRSEDNIGEKIKTLRIELDNFKELLEGKVQKETLEEFRKNDALRFEELTKKLQEDLLNMNPTSKQPTIDPAITEKLIKLEALVNSLNSRDNSNKILLDQAKLSELDQIIGRHNQLFKTIQEELSKKVDSSTYNSSARTKAEDRPQRNISDDVLRDLRHQVSDLASKVNNLERNDRERERVLSFKPSHDGGIDMQTLLNSVERLKVELSEILEIKFQTLIADKLAERSKSNELNELAEEVTLKANDQEVKKGFHNTDAKIMALVEISNGFKKAIEQILQLKKPLPTSQSQTVIQQLDINPLLATKKVLPLTRMSLQKNEFHILPAKNMVKGIDGKFYHGDPNANTIRQGQQIQQEPEIDIILIAANEEKFREHSYLNHANLAKEGNIAVISTISKDANTIGNPSTNPPQIMNSSMTMSSAFEKIGTVDKKEAFKPMRPASAKK